MYKLLRSFLFLFPPERAHHIALCWWGVLIRIPLCGGLLRRIVVGPILNSPCTIAGIHFPSRVGLAAGFDKNGRHLKELRAFGFGFVEIGTVTAKAQPGNPTPRLFRLPHDAALINRMGFNNAGALVVKKNWRKPLGMIVGINIGKSKVCPLEDAAEDYRYSTKLLADIADYLVINVSSPNTPGLRELQTIAKLRPIVEAVQHEMQVNGVSIPVFLKLAPDLANADLLAIADFSIEVGLTGLIATNTTISREGLNTSPDILHAIDDGKGGGLSGSPLKKRALEVLNILKTRVGDALVLISVGGIDSAAEACARLEAGASLVQLYTAFIYQGPRLVREISEALAQRSS